MRPWTLPGYCQAATPVAMLSRLPVDARRSLASLAGRAGPGGASPCRNMPCNTTLVRLGGLTGRGRCGGGGLARGGGPCRPAAGLDTGWLLDRASGLAIDGSGGLGRTADVPLDSWACTGVGRGGAGLAWLGKAPGEGRGDGWELDAAGRTRGGGRGNGEAAALADGLGGGAARGGAQAGGGVAAGLGARGGGGMKGASPRLGACAGDSTCSRATDSDLCSRVGSEDDSLATAYCGFPELQLMLRALPVIGLWDPAAAARESAGGGGLDAALGGLGRAG